VILGAVGTLLGPGRVTFMSPKDVFVGAIEALFQVKEVYEGEAAIYTSVVVLRSPYKLRVEPEAEAERTKYLKAMISTSLIR